MDEDSLPLLISISKSIEELNSTMYVSHNMEYDSQSQSSPGYVRKSRMLTKSSTPFSHQAFTPKCL